VSAPGGVGRQRRADTIGPGQGELAIVLHKPSVKLGWHDARGQGTGDRKDHAREIDACLRAALRTGASVSVSVNHPAGVMRTTRSEATVL
jgi:hypothetical protein